MWNTEETTQIHAPKHTNALTHTAVPSSEAARGQHYVSQEKVDADAALAPWPPPTCSTSPETCHWPHSATAPSAVSQATLLPLEMYPPAAGGRENPTEIA